MSRTPGSTNEALGGRARTIGALGDDLRRKLFLFIRRKGVAVSRIEAARAAGISTKLAAFHLDKLVDQGLLEAHYARLPGRRGPGAGRSSKLYRPADREVQMSIPPRAYDVAGAMLVEALDSKRPDESGIDAARRVGRRRGTAVGAGERGPRPSTSGPGPAGLRAAKKTLDKMGFEPRSRRGEVTLANCPFHALAEQNPALVCGLNHAFIEGVIDGLGATDQVEAMLRPESDRCCVVLRGLGSAQ